MNRLIGMIALFGLLGCGENGSTNTVSLGPLEAKFIYLEGDVTVFGAPAELDMQVPKGALIQTASDSFAEIRISTGNIISLGPGTSLVWNFHFYTPQINLNGGNLAAVLTSLAENDSGERLRLVTPTTVAGVRGTSFFAQIAKGGENTYFCLCNGSILLQNGEEWMEVQAAEHAAFDFTKRDGEVKMEVAELLYHDNDSMNTLASKIGHEIDWTEPQSH
jgi:hypothetical protein